MKWDRSFAIGLVAGLSTSLILVSVALGVTVFILFQQDRATVLNKPETAPKIEAAALQAGMVPKAPPINKPALAPARGPENAPVVLESFMDFECGYCRQAARTLLEVNKNYPGVIRQIFRHFPLSSTPGQGSYLIHEIATCAAEQNKFWQFYDAVFALDQNPDPVQISALEARIGLDAVRLDQCVTSGKYRAFINSELDAGRARGVEGTPVIYLNGKEVSGAVPYETFRKMIDGVLNPGSVAAADNAAPAPKPEKPAPPRIVEFNDLKGLPSQGPENAPVTLVEFSDFHCPFCGRLDPTLKKVITNFPDQVRRVWRHFPLDMHQGARRTHEASQCAAEFGKFWEYHDVLFNNMSGPHDDATLTKYADQVGIKEKKFKKCLESGKYQKLIESEIQKGEEAGVQGTPAVFVNGQLVSGAQPYENFERMIKSKLTER